MSDPIQPFPLTRRGQEGHPVKTLQHLLDAHSAGLTVDGIFGRLALSRVGLPARATNGDWSRRVTELPSGTVTFLFTDIEGSTQLLRRLGDRYTAVLAEHQRLLRDAFAENGGLEVDQQGDAF